MTAAIDPASEMRPLHQFFETIQGGPLQQHANLEILPLLLLDDVESGPPPFISLSDALTQETFSVKELDQGASVRSVQARNRGRVPVLVLFGEQMLGAKQNRAADASFLIPAYSSVVIHVSCVEKGRWHSGPGRSFRASRGVISSALRTKMARSVTESPEQGGRFKVDQDEVWSEVQKRVSLSGIDSATESYDDYQERWSKNMEEAIRAFTLYQRQVGFVAFRPASQQQPARVLGVEAVGRPETFMRQFYGLLRSYLLDAVDKAMCREIDAESAQDEFFEEAKPFLRAVCDADYRVSRSPGCGEELRLDGTEVSGAALLHRGVVNLTAFPFPKPQEPKKEERRVRLRPEVQRELDQIRARAQDDFDKRV